MDRSVSTQSLGARRPAPPGNVRSSRLSSLPSFVQEANSSGGESQLRRSSSSLLESPEIEYNQAASPTSAGGITPGGRPRTESVASSASGGPSRLIPSSSDMEPSNSLGKGMDLTERPSSPDNIRNGMPSSPVSSINGGAPLSPPSPVRRSAGAGAALGEISLDDLRNALEGVSRDDLLIALGRTKHQIDLSEAEKEEHLLHIETLQSHLSDLSDRFSGAQSDIDMLHAQIAAQEEKMEEMAKDQERLEDELYSKTGVLDRLRKQLDECEKGRAEAERRYADQSTTLDKERQYYNDAEALVKSQKTNIQSQVDKLSKQNSQLMKENERMLNQLTRLKASQKGANDPDVIADPSLQDTKADGSEDARFEEDAEDAEQDENNEHDRSAPNSGDVRNSVGKRSLQDEAEAAQLRDELESMQRSHTSLQQTMQRLQMEIKELKNANKDLRDQNETFQGVLEERTFSGSLLKNSALLRSAGALDAASEMSSTIDGDSDEEPMDKETETDDTRLSIDDVDDVDDLPITPKSATSSSNKSKRRSAAVRTGRDGRQELSTEDGFVAPLPTDLGSELEQVEGEDAEEGDGNEEARKARNIEKRRKRAGTLSKDVKELQDEILSLRDANKGLTLYVSKILDRIIAREGYENILAIDPEHKRTMRGASGAGTLGRSRTKRSSVLPINKSPEAGRGSSSEVYQPPAGQSKRHSVGLLGYSRAPGQGPAPTAAPEVGPRYAPKRTTSVDWRGLLPSAIGGTSSTSSTNQSNFRPLALQSALVSRQSSAGSSSVARKVESHEEMEDDNDIAERERIRASLQLQGIVTPAHQLKQVPLSPSIGGHTSDRRSSPLMSAGHRAPGPWGGFLSRVMSTSTSVTTAPSPNLSQSGGQSPAADSSNTAGFMGPRLTTFDDPTPARPQVGSEVSAGSGKRMQVTQTGASGAGPTELLPRMSARRAGSSGAAAVKALGGGSDAGNISFASRAGSVAGDESYAQAASADGTAGVRGGPEEEVEEAEEEEPGWKKALKRVSLLARSVPVNNTGAQ
ncbi:hypothetical protein K437DRAFT_254795 [Tilletiaria anomala UBC 951]|uniref:Uncharacterized protein n=1 Tax=Tilletiaria anomala (strain ATCC 24038 / CBS 436.72 / UBC 951) TaxID=1037660 RepID=A0A066WBU0_TILAU|nr:uncharacterized protein K437DRAFT_254795 [Tilletiaria anomala UBC 951]KDN51387.1 hypothetical protein K437DRAFT_254795 [Tilletiaria anomala UBC 951]